jgi:hypothetical protein
MQTTEQKSFQQARNHAEQSRKEIDAMLSCIFPQAFWEHAKESRKETRLALKAAKRAVSQKCSRKIKRNFPMPHKIEIA